MTESSLASEDTSFTLAEEHQDHKNFISTVVNPNAQDHHDIPRQFSKEVEFSAISKQNGRRPTQHGDTAFKTEQKNPTKLVAIFVVIVIIVNAAAIGLCIGLFLDENSEQCLAPGAEKEVVAPLCVPCDDQGRKEDQQRSGEWRRIQEGDQDICCPLDHQTFAAAVQEIYRDVLKEKQHDFKENRPKAYPVFAFRDEPQTTDDRVLFTNHRKPSAHVTGVRPFNATRHFLPDDNTNVNDSIQVVSDWPLRFEPYRSMTTGYVQRLTWGLVVPATGLYRVHSSVNFYFAYPQNTRDIDKSAQPGKHIDVVHQLTRFHAADGMQTMLTERNQTISSDHTDGLTSFLVTLEELDVGDVISVSVSHRSAFAMRDRWHSEGLFLVQ